MYPHSDNDKLTMALAGAVPMAQREGSVVQGQLLDGGEHFDDDHDRRVRRRRPPQGVLVLLLRVIPIGTMSASCHEKISIRRLLK